MITENNTRNCEKMAPIMDPIRREQFIELGGGEYHLLSGLLQKFISSSESILYSIRAEIESGNFERIRSLLHTLKGSSSNLGLVRIADEVERFQTQVRQGININFSQSWVALKHRIQEVRDHIYSQESNIAGS